MDYIGIIIGASLVNNYVLTKLIGITPFINSPKNVWSSLFMGLSVTLTLFLSSIFLYIISVGIIKPLGLESIDLLFYTLIILILSTIIQKALQHNFPNIYSYIGVYFPVITYNSVLFGAGFELTNNAYVFDFGSAILYFTFSGVGYTISLLLLSFLRSRISETNIPQYLTGAPLTLICAGFLSLIFQLLSRLVPLI